MHISPQPEVWGSHGLERLRSDGHYEVSSVPAHQDYLLAATSLLSDAGLEAQTEVKPGGVAVHWRGLDPLKAGKLAREVPRLWKPLLDRDPDRAKASTAVGLRAPISPLNGSSPRQCTATPPGLTSV